MYRPAWVQTFARKYFTKTIAQFILHGNIADFVRSEPAGASPKYLKLKDYLMFELFKRRDLIITYDRASGIAFRDPAMKQDFMHFLSAYDQRQGTKFSQEVPKDPIRAFAILEFYFKIRLQDGKKIAFIVDYAETLVPMNTAGYANPEDRAILVFLLKWAKESLFLNSDMTTVLLTDNLNDIHTQLSRNPYTCEIDIPYPDENERFQFIQLYTDEHRSLTGLLEMKPEVLAKMTAGLNIVQLKTLLAEITENNEKFTFKQLNERKKDIIETEAGGLLEFIETRFSLKDVAGHKYAKENLLAAAAALKNGRQDVMPMGYLVNGPVGTGKTFLISCFASDIGVPMVQLKNFRSQWQGATEANLEKVLKLLKAMNPVAVMIDEADAYLGNRNAQGDSGVSNRVFSMLATYMSNTEHRGKIIWFLITARPDLLAVDFKRQGRAEEHIALFYPETLAEKRELLEIMLRKTGITELKIEDFSDEFFNHMTVRSGADMEAALTRAKFKVAARGLEKLTVELVRETFADFIPPTYPEEIELMNLAAVMECTSKELLPEHFRRMTTGEVLDRVADLKRRIALRSGN